ncbi:MAG TPA: hypothetical protein VGD05_01285 [Pyrinomonadaceae bacterium]|jgi:hypothetical protein
MSDFKVFQCPNCQQFINNQTTTCKYCSVSLDAQTISAAVESQDYVNDAYNSASNLRILAGVLVTAFFVRLIPFISIFGNVLFLIIFFGLPLLLIFWQIRYGRIKTTDKEFKQAKKYWLTSLLIWLIFPGLFVIIITIAMLGGGLYSYYK